MKRIPYILSLALLALAPAIASAQNVAITNVRIVTGTGLVIPNGNILVRDGKILSVSAGAPASTEGLQVIDGKGMSAMPGFIDGHKHVNPGPQEKEQLQSLLEAGYTTVLMGGGQADANLGLANRVASG